jgi:hypothetical protein
MMAAINHLLAFMAAGWQEGGDDSAPVAGLLKIRPNAAPLAAKKPQLACRNAGSDSKRWNYGRL